MWVPDSQTLTAGVVVGGTALGCFRTLVSVVSANVFVIFFIVVGFFVLDFFVLGFFVLGFFFFFLDLVFLVLSGFFVVLSFRPQTTQPRSIKYSCTRA